MAANVWLKKCDICDINYDRTVEAHELTKKHKAGVARESTVYVKLHGMDIRKSEDEKEIFDFLKQFGTVVRSSKDEIRGTYVLAQLDSMESATKILSLPKEKLNFGNGKDIEVSKKRKRDDRNKDLKEQEVKNHKDACQEFDLLKLSKNCFSVEEQIDALIEKIDSSITQEDLMKRQAVCDELNDVLTTFLPHTTIELFGSAANGLGVKTSDLDITVLFNLEKYEETSEPCISKKPFPYIDDSDVKTAHLQNTETREINVQGLKKLVNDSPRHNAIRLVSRLIGSENTGFTELINRTGGRCPVIKAHHGGTNIPCDITCENRLGPRNTRLIKFYQTLDPRVRQLFYALRVVGSIIGFSGSIVGGSPKMTNYCLYMMIIFYLQNTQPPVLPTVLELAELADDSEKLTLDGYDTSYTTDFTRIHRPTNYSSIQRLLCDFFIFFADFDFSYYVICPRTGKAIPILEIDKFCSFKEGTTFVPKVIHVQDPFVLDQNIAGNTNKYTLDLMVLAMRLCRQKVIEPSFGEPTVSGVWGLAALDVTEAVRKDELEKANKSSAKNECEVQEKWLPGGRQAYIITIRLSDRHSVNYLPIWQPLTNASNLTALKQWWTYRAVDAVIHVLEGPMKAEVIPEAENLEDLVAEYHRIKTQLLVNKRNRAAKKKAAADAVSNTEDPPAKKFRPCNRIRDEPIQKQQQNFGVLYSPNWNQAFANSYDVKMQKIFSPENYGKKQLLYSAECKMYSRANDLLHSRNTARAQLVEGGLKHIFHETEPFCAFESKVSDIALKRCQELRPNDKVVESDPVLEFHTHISVINNKGENIKVEIVLEDDKTERDPKQAFGDNLVALFKGLMMKLVVHCSF